MRIYRQRSAVTTAADLQIIENHGFEYYITLMSFFLYLTQKECSKDE